MNTSYDVGANVDATDKIGNTALMFAARDGHKDKVQMLVKDGANVDATDKIGNTALMFAACYGHVTRSRCW